MTAPQPKIDETPAGPETRPGATAVERASAAGAVFVIERLGLEAAPLRLVWLHGWGQSRGAFRPLAERFAAEAENLLLDLPGFGDAPPPPGDWGTAQYGAMIAEWLKGLGRAGAGTILVCHSFGGRVALRLASAYPDLVQGLVLIASAGLRRKRSPAQRVRATILRLTLRGAVGVDRLARTGLAARLRERLGSADYRRAGAMRGVLVRTVNEDLTQEARRVRCPVLLVYGALDDEAPPEFGTRFASLIPSAELAILPSFDHFTILGPGRHQVESLMRRYLGKRGSAP